MSTTNSENMNHLPEDSSFEAVLSRLEATVQSLEQGDLSLEEATRLYEDGIYLSRICNQILDKAELKVSELKTDDPSDTSEYPLESIDTQSEAEE